MTIEKQINEWLEASVITKEQARKMLLDVNAKHKEEKSNKFIMALSTIGASLLGIGAILFVSSNWEVLPDIFKILLFLGSTFLSYYLGYLFKYKKKNLLKVGETLLLLSALLFGATVFLVAQIYNINPESHFLILIWLTGVLSLVYTFKSKPIAVLALLVFLIWCRSLLLISNGFDWDLFSLFPVIYLTVGIFLFAIGGLHYLNPKLSDIARIFRIGGIKIAMISLFLLTFRFFSGHKKSAWFSRSEYSDISEPLMIGMVLFAILSMVGLLINLKLNPSRSKLNLFENGTALVVLGGALFFLFFPLESNLYTIIYNVLFALITLFLIFTGYNNTDIKIVNTGIFWLSVLVFARYFDFFWDLISRSLFFMIGGFILVLGGVLIEKNRKKLKEKFIKLNA